MTPRWVRHLPYRDRSAFARPRAWKTAYVQPLPPSLPATLRCESQSHTPLLSVRYLDEASPGNVRELSSGVLLAIGMVVPRPCCPLCRGRLGEPTLGAWGLGWEVWLNGMEVTQFTCFQRVSGIECDPVPVEITLWPRAHCPCTPRALIASTTWCGPPPDGTPMTYGDVFLENEREFSAYNFESRKRRMMMRQKFDDDGPSAIPAGRKLPLPAYDCVMKCSHAFNLLDARGAFRPSGGANYILRVRAVPKACCDWPTWRRSPEVNEMPARGRRGWRKPWQTLRLSCLRSVRRKCPPHR